MTREQIARFFAAEAVCANPIPSADAEVAKAMYHRILAALNTIKAATKSV